MRKLRFLKDKIHIHLIVVSLMLISVIIPCLQSRAQMPIYEELDYNSIIKEIDIQRIDQHVKFFSSLGSRVTGYPGYEKAAEYIFQQFQALGLINVSFEYYDVAVPIDYGATVTIINDDGTSMTFTAYPFWPNLFQTSPIPSPGLTAPIVYAGKGLEGLNGKDVAGSIVLMDIDSGDEWKRVLALGAKAIIFTGNEEEIERTQAEKKVTNLPIYIPRLFIKESDGEIIKKLIETQRILGTLTSNFRYEKIRAKNVVGFLPGTTIIDEIAAISAHFDSFSYIPSLSPGAQEALGISTLLELVRCFKNNPPLRTLEFIAFSGFHQSMAGPTEWTEAQFNNLLGGTFKVRVLISLDYETSVATLGIYPHDAFYPVGGEMYYSPVPPRCQALYFDIFSNILPKMKREIGYKSELILDVQSDPARLGWEPVPQVVAASAFVEAGGIGFGFRTTQTPRPYQFTPSDIPSRINYANLIPQLQFTYIVLTEIVNKPFYILQETWPTRVQKVHWGFGTIEGIAVVYNYSKGWYDPLPNALVYLRTDPVYTRPAQAFFTDIYYWIEMADENGRFTIHGVRPTSGFLMWYTVEVYGIDQETGRINYAPDLGEYGEKTFSSKIYFDKGWLGSKDNPRPFVAFPCGTIALHGLVDPTTFATEGVNIDVNNFFSHGKFLSWGTTQLSTTRGMALMSKSPPLVAGSGGLADALVFIPAGEVAEILIKTGYYSYPIAILLNSTKDEPKGYGYVLKQGEYLDLYNTAESAARGLYYLVDQRLSLYSSFNTYSPSATSYYQKAKSSLSLIEEAFERKDYTSYFWEAYTAWAYTINAYHMTMDLTFNVIYASIFFYIFLLPFTFLGERLFIPQTEGRRRLIVMIAIFGIVAGILYLVHPGFHIAANVGIATLGFTIFVLSLPVVVMIAGRLGRIVTELRKKLLGAHFTEISRVSAVLIAFSMGIENMRKRKLRSFLTLFTIIIITFSLVIFTSGSTITITRSQSWKMTPSYSGLLIREVPWKPIPLEVVSYFVNAYQKTGNVAIRFWVYGPGQELILRNISNNRTTVIAGMLGLSPSEDKITRISQTIISGRYFEIEDGASKICILSDETANKLNASLGDSIEALGFNFTVIGIFNGQRLTSLEDLDQEPLTPLDTSVPLPPGAEVMAITGKEVAHVHGSRVMLIPYETAIMFGLEMGPSGASTNRLPSGIYSVAVGLDNPSISKSIAEAFSTRSRKMVFAVTATDEVSIYIPRKAFALAGLEIIAVPLVIATLIIMNTMMGSVAERVREIGILSSIGLSPLHVGGMFIAEFFVFGVIAGIIGYVMGIFTVKLLYSFLLIPEGFYFNPSSYFVIIAICFSVFASVVPAIYPIYKASKLVTPTLERKWKPTTKPVGLDWNIVLPFALPSQEVPGVIAYMKEFFEAHTTERVGVFMSSDIKVDTRLEEGRKLWEVKAIVRLQPLDQGIVQTTRLVAMPTKEGDKCNFSLLLHREAGVEHTWKTSNYLFAGEIRRQLLLWSSIREFEREKYVKMGLSLLEGIEKKLGG